MQTITEEDNKTDEYVLNANDRCDRCAAQAYVKVIGNLGELLFCSHHYNKVIDDAIGHDKIMKFMVQIIDERKKLQ
jgi:hypothetical protein